jgi:Uma2 family endonuclease
MITDATKKLFTVDEFYRMADAGIFTEHDRVELIDGEIIQMSAIGVRHAGCVNRANTFFTESFGRNAVVSIQNPLRLTTYTEPTPDIVVLKPREDFYSSHRFTPEDVLLVVEVADTTLRYDRNVKIPRYAAAGILEVWIEDLNSNVLLIYRDPAKGTFRAELTLHRRDSISPLAFPDVTFKVEDLLG